MAFGLGKISVEADQWLDVLVGNAEPPTYRIGGLEKFGPSEKPKRPKGQTYVGMPPIGLDGSGRWVRRDPGLRCIEDAYQRQNVIFLAVMASLTSAESFGCRVFNLTRNKRNGTYEFSLSFTGPLERDEID